MRERFRGNRGSRKLRKESRTTPVYGSYERGGGEDSKKWYRCWNCGFICNDERDTLGDAYSRSGVVHEDYNPKENVVTRNMGIGASGDTTYAYLNEPDRSIYGSNSIEGNTAVLGGSINSYTVAGEADSAGDSKKVRHPIRVSNKSYGCPLCHSLNWRGDY